MGDWRTGALCGTAIGLCRLHGFLHHSRHSRPKLWWCILRLSLAILVDPCLDLACHPSDRPLREDTFLPRMGLFCSRRGNFFRLDRLAKPLVAPLALPNFVLALSTVIPVILNLGIALFTGRSATLAL